jgi:N-acetyl sugar amidotransferase
MDTSDPDIRFDGEGVCSHCREYARLSQDSLYSGPDGQKRLDALVDRIKEEGKGKEYDCILGLSGGVDSSFVAYKAKELGLRPLAVHLDNGWNSELSVANIERIVKRLDIDLYTYVIDWEEFRELQISFFKASVVDIELLTDHAIAAVLFDIARKNHLRYFLSGYNVATESIMPKSWFFGNKLDGRNIKAIFREFGDKKRIESFPILSFYKYILFVYARRLKVIPLLNYLSYNKSEAMAILQEKLGWVYYGGKHYESRFTQFYQAYILPKKFHIDKRRAHLSSLIYSGQLSRDEALKAMEEELYTPGKFREDKEFVVKKLGMTESEFEEYMNLPPRSHLEYANYEALTRWLRPVGRFAKNVFRRK